MQGDEVDDGSRPSDEVSIHLPLGSSVNDAADTVCIRII